MKQEGLLQRIQIAPGVRSGKPLVAGTRITVGDVLGYMSSGMSIEEVLDEFPALTREDVNACLLFGRPTRSLG